MPSLFSKWKDEQSEISYRKGFVTYNLMQTTAYEHLGPIQVLEIVPDYIFEKFLTSQVCTKTLTKFFEDHNLLHHINRFINQDGWDKGLTLVGFLRKNYVDKIKNGMNICYFFYENDSNKDLQIHPEILRCNKFIGYEEGNRQNRKITGEVIPEIKKVEVSELSEMIKQSGIYDYHNTHKSYYCMKIQNVKIEKMSDEEYKELVFKVGNARGNFLLSKHSPKVI